MDITDEETPEALAERLSRIDAEIRALLDDAFARKFELSSEADGLRKALAEHHRDALEAARTKWAERAGRKGEHEEVDPAVAEALIQNPIDPGGMA